MALEKLTLLRDENKDSEKTSKELKERGIEFREVFSDSERIMPCLIVPGKAYSFRGYNSILEYINSLYPTK
ncbi:MAG: hypothetical protein ACP5NZ_01075 [Nanobdellota archaeon]